MRLALLCVGVMFVTASAVCAGELAEAPRKDIEAIFKDKIFKNHARIDPTKTKFDSQGNQLEWTVEILTDKADREIAEALADGEVKTLVLKNADGGVLGSIRLDTEADFVRGGLKKKGDKIPFVVRFGDVDVSKVKSVVGGK
jgi:hypothetical protein